MWLIFKKEFKELLRDKKTIIFMIGLPLLLFPAIFGVAFFFMSSAADKAENKVLKYAIVGEAYAPAIVQSFNDASDKFEPVVIGDETGDETVRPAANGSARACARAAVCFGTRPVRSGA